MRNGSLPLRRTSSTSPGRRRSIASLTRTKVIGHVSAVMSRTSPGAAWVSPGVWAGFMAPTIARPAGRQNHVAGFCPRVVRRGRFVYTTPKAARGPTGTPAALRKRTGSALKIEKLCLERDETPASAGSSPASPTPPTTRRRGSASPRQRHRPQDQHRHRLSHRAAVRGGHPREARLRRRPLATEEAATTYDHLIDISRPGDRFKRRMGAAENRQRVQRSPPARALRRA